MVCLVLKSEVEILILFLEESFGMSFSGKISKRKNSGAVLLGTFMVPAAFSAASQSVAAAGMT